MAKTVCKILGIAFLLVGVLGFTTVLNFLGAHLTAAQNVVHIVSGLAALYFGFAASVSAARAFCLVFGVVYLGLGVLGLALGNPGQDRMWQVGPLMLGTVDHGLHIILGAAFLAGGLFTKKGA
jgi:uncharacterized membrane protein YuzA (DUF378 family)